MNVEKTDEYCSAFRDIGYAITAAALPGHDAAGGTVASLTEAIMGVTAGLFAIAQALERMADQNDR